MIVVGQLWSHLEAFEQSHGIRVWLYIAPGKNRRAVSHNGEIDRRDNQSFGRACLLVVGLFALCAWEGLVAVPLLLYD